MRHPTGAARRIALLESGCVEDRRKPKEGPREGWSCAWRVGPTYVCAGGVG